MTLVEVMVALGLSSLLLATIMMIWLFGFRSYGAMFNYTDLSNQNRNAMDLISRDIREATLIVGFQNVGTTKWLELTNASGERIRYTWDGESRTLVCARNDEAPVTYLTGCERWDFQVSQRTPNTETSYLFYPATNIDGIYDPSICKVVNMRWKCYRTLLDRLNTESVQTAQVVLRNKQ